MQRPGALDSRAASAHPAALPRRPRAGGEPRLVLGIVRRLQVLLPVAIMLFVVVHQAVQSLLLPDEAVGARFLVNVAVYGLVGPWVTWRTLGWIAKRLEQQSAAEARAGRDERFLAAIAAGSADAILGLDADGFVRSWSRGAREILGYAEAEIVGRPVAELMPPGLQPHGNPALIRRALEERGYLRGLQARCRHKDGRVVAVDLTQTLVRAEGGAPLGSSVILRDMSTRIEAEREIMTLNRQLEARVVERTRQLEEASAALRERNEALRAANAELEDLDALKDEFVALVSHELRAPLTNVRASAELLLAREEDPAKRDKLEIVGQEAERLARLVRGVLDASRMRAGRFTVKPAPIEAGELVRASMTRLSEEMVARVCLSLQDTSPGPHWVLADAERVGEVLDNLLDNALKYSPPGSTIEIVVGPNAAPKASSGPVTVETSKTGMVGNGRVTKETVTKETVQFAITDHGIGIPPEETERIFDRFHRVERGDAKQTYGHGLGLYIARQIIEAHGGTLVVRSRQGEGSTFLFRLPAAPEE